MKKYDVVRMALCGGDFLLRKILATTGRIRFVVLCLLWGVKYDGLGCFAGRIVIRNTCKGKIRLGRQVTAYANFRLNPIGAASPTLLDVRPGGEIEIGDGTGMSSAIISSCVKIAIGRHCKIGGGVKIIDHNFHSLDAVKRRALGGDEAPRAIKIEDDVFIGTNAIILKGTHIGARSVIGAGSVVFGLEIPSDSLVYGNPASIVERK